MPTAPFLPRRRIQFWRSLTQPSAISPRPCRRIRCCWIPNILAPRLATNERTEDRSSMWSVPEPVAGPEHPPQNRQADRQENDHHAEADHRVDVGNAIETPAE